MFGRRTRTNLPTTTELLSISYDESALDALLDAKRRQANYYDRRARPREPLSVGDTVRTRWNNHDDWEKAEITKVLPYRSYQLRFEDGSMRRRTSKHVRFSSEPPLVIRGEIEVAPTANGAPPHQHVQRRRDVLQSDQLRNASHRDNQRCQLLGTISLSPDPDAMSNAPEIR